MICVVQRESGNRHGENRSRAQRPAPRHRGRTLAFHPPHRLHFAVARALHRMPASDTGVHVIFKQEDARGRQLLSQICRNQCLKVLRSFAACAR